MGFIKIPALQNAVAVATQINNAIKNQIAQSPTLNAPCDTCGRKITKH